MSIASGLPFHGHPVFEKMRVVYVATEGLPYLKNRILSWQNEHHNPEYDLSLITTNKDNSSNSLIDIALKSIDQPDFLAIDALTSLQ